MAGNALATSGRVEGPLYPLTDQGLGLQTDVNLWDTLQAHEGEYQKIKSAKHVA
jgi:hypothetical protein